MADLRNTSVGANYRRALDNFSRFGTRKLAFYAIRIYGLSQEDANLENGEDLYDPEYPREWVEAPGHIVEAIQRGVQLVAEPYAFGDWDSFEIDTDYWAVYLPAIVAADTVLDDQGQNDSPVPANENSYTLQSAVEAALGDNWNYDYVEVERMILRGDTLDTTGDYALGRNAGANKTSRVALINAKLADGKISLKRKP
jgi:hypothetical protein